MINSDKRLFQKKIWQKIIYKKEVGKVTIMFCGMETIDHLMFHCPLAKLVWGHCDLGIGSQKCPWKLPRHVAGWLNRNLLIVGVAAICWSLWKTRNQACFQNKIISDPNAVIYMLCSWLTTGLFCSRTRRQIGSIKERRDCARWWRTLESWRWIGCLWEDVLVMDEEVSREGFFWADCSWCRECELQVASLSLNGRCMSVSAAKFKWVILCFFWGRGRVGGAHISGALCCRNTCNDHGFFIETRGQFLFLKKNWPWLLVIQLSCFSRAMANALEDFQMQYNSSRTIWCGPCCFWHRHA